MYKNRAADGSNNLCGRNIKKYREVLPAGPSQRAFSDLLQIEGLNLDKNAIQRIESGKRFVTDIELRTIAKALHVSCEDLLK